MQSLLSTTTRVEVPYIAVKIGKCSFGLYDKTKTNVEVNGKYYSEVKVTYPNYVQSLNVTKINGTLNTYVLTLIYAIRPGDDPNLIDKILSASNREITFTYGDCATPAFMYKEEKGLITNVTQSLDTNNAKITYTINAVSTALGLTAGIFNFPAYSSKKPSDIIIDLLFNYSYGLQDIFYGMHSKEQVLQKNLIARDDKAVKIEAKSGISVLDYLGYLTQCMCSSNDLLNSVTGRTRYVLVIHDDTTGVLDGPYFTVEKMATSLQSNSSIEYYTLDIGYPSKDFISNFNITDNQAYALLYDYSQEIKQPNYVYRIGDDGAVEETYSPALTNSSTLMKTTEADKTWWSQMTQYPIRATVTLKGLLRAAILMSYIRVNIYYYGKKHNSSGVFLITKQEDSISTSGYSTTLTLLRIEEDDEI